MSPMPMLNVRSMSSSGTPPALLEPLEDRRHAATPTRSIARVRARRQHARQVVGDAAAGDVRHALDDGPRVAEQRADDRQIRTMRREQRLADRARRAPGPRHPRDSPATSNTMRRASE